MIVSPPPASMDQGLTSLALSDAGGVTQFGLHLQSLAPGATTGIPHWHSAEDEMLFLMEGEATLIDRDGETRVLPGEALCFRRGDANAHAMANRSKAPCRWVMIGARAKGDICTYADGRRQVNGVTDWHIESPFGERLKGGALPAHLLNLMEPWGTPPPEAPRHIRPTATPAHATHPILGGDLGPYVFQLLSDPGGLTQFGAFIETLPPGSASSFRHWHRTEDEMALILTGQPTLVETAETRLTPGDVLAWPAGTPVGHALRNDSAGPVSYLVVGTRLTDDVITYPDHDLITHKSGPARRYTHADGRPR